MQAADYISFLRRGGKELSRTTDFVAKMYQAYGEFRPVVQDLIGSIDEYNDPKDHTAFLGEGTNANAFTFDYKGRTLVARVPRGDAVGNGLAYDDAVTFEQGNDIPNLQHLVAAAPDRGIIITELLPGKNLTDMTYEELLAVPKEHLAELVELGFKMHDHGLGTDPKSSNYMYDPIHGFSLLDYGRLDNPNAEPRDKYLSALSTIRSVVDGKASTFAYNEDEPYDSDHNQAYSLEVSLNGMRLQQRLLEVLQTSYPEILQAAAAYQREMDADPNQFGGDAFQVNIEHMPVEGSEELKRYKDQLLSLGIASAHE